MTTRSGKRWNINELLSLQREYELLEWSVQQIAEKHERTVEAILFKLEAEGFITSWNEARGFDSKLYQSTWTTSGNECQCDERPETSGKHKIVSRGSYDPRDFYSGTRRK